MNKNELVDAIATKATVTKKDADFDLTAVIEAMMDAVSSGEKVTLVVLQILVGYCVAAGPTHVQ